MRACNKIVKHKQYVFMRGKNRGLLFFDCSTSDVHSECISFKYSCSAFDTLIWIAFIQIASKNIYISLINNSLGCGIVALKLRSRGSYTIGFFLSNCMLKCVTNYSWEPNAFPQIIELSMPNARMKERLQIIAIFQRHWKSIRQTSVHTHTHVQMKRVYCVWIESVLCQCLHILIYIRRN